MKTKTFCRQLLFNDRIANLTQNVIFIFLLFISCSICDLSRTLTQLSYDLIIVQLHQLEVEQCYNVDITLFPIA